MVAVLWWVMLAGSVALFALVAVLLWLAYRPATPLGKLGDRTWLVGGGLVLPALVLIPLAIAGFVIGERTLAHHGAPDLRVEATGRQWGWDFGYPDAASPNGDRPRTTNVLHIPAGRTVEVLVTSQDVIHSFWVPRLAGKIDAIPGHVNRIRLRADNPGEYQGVCAEFCGRHHADMGFVVVAHDPQAYQAALRAAGSEGTP